MANKKKENLKFKSVDLLSYNPTISEEVTMRGNKYVSWGRDNNYPQYIYDIYSNCATLQSVINGSIDYTFGNGIVNNTPFKGLNQEGDSIEDVVKKVITDRWIFGGANIQVIPNRLGMANEVIALDTRFCRTDEDMDFIYYSKKWGCWGQNRAVKYPRFQPGKLDSSQVYYHKGVNSRGIYPVCDYAAALVSAETQIEIQKFHYNTIVNNFMVNGILNFNNAGDVPDENKSDIERMVNDKFSGSENAARLMIAWNEDKEKAITFERLSDNQFDDKYQALSNSTRENLFVSLRAIPVLFGLTVQTGFNTQEYQEAFNLYNRTAIIPKQKEIVRIFDAIFQMEDSISFIPFSLEAENP